jgi:N-acetyl sugar amidotransferase
MDTSDPDITFGEDGVCNHCTEHEADIRDKVFSGADGRRRLESLAEEVRSQGKGLRYDCLIGVSGGVDSTYTAWLVRQLGLRPLAVHLDNGWNSDIAVRNISNAVGTLGIDLHTHVIDWEEYRDIQRAFLLASVPDVEVPTDHAILACMYREAKRFRIPAIVIGTNTRTESHLPAGWSRGHRDWGYIRTVHRTFGTGAVRTFPHLGLSDFLLPGRNRPRTLEFLNYVDYDKEGAKATIERELGWQDYGGKHFESVFTRWYQGCYLPRKFGFDKRRTHLSSLISTGQLTRERALEILREPPYDPARQDADCEYVAKKLGFGEAEFRAIMSAPPKRFEDYWSFAKRIETPMFKSIRALGRRVRRLLPKRVP